MPTDLNAALHESIETAQPLISAKNHTLTVELPEQPIRVEADPERLAQVFSNLLINAAKYTDPGGRISVRAVRTTGDAVVSVRDNGIGVATDMLPQLFGIDDLIPKGWPEAAKIGGVAMPRLAPYSFWEAQAANDEGARSGQRDRPAVNDCLLPTI